MSADQSRHLSGVLRRRDGLFAALGWTLMLATGCGSKDKEIATRMSLNLIAGADVNPDAKGRASPLTVRLYALKSPSAFTSADFFSLYDKDSATLGADLVRREETLLRPGETKALDFSVKSDARTIALGVMAAYRDLERAHWREVHMLDAGKSYRLDLLFSARQIQVTRR